MEEETVDVTMPVANRQDSGMSRVEQRRARQAEVKHSRERMFMASQKVARAEFQQLINAVMNLSREVSVYRGFVRNMFFTLDHKGVVSLKEIDEIAKAKSQELKDFQEIAGNNNIPLSEKIEIAKQKGLSQLFMDLLVEPGAGS